MPGGRWDFFQPLINYEVKWPTGPLDPVPPDEHHRWLDAWVVQRTDFKLPIFHPGGIGGGGIGASQKSAKKWPYPWPLGTATPAQWTADTPGWRGGDFQNGPALGIALVASHDPTATDPYAFYWWIDVIFLLPPPLPSSIAEAAAAGVIEVNDEFMKRFDVQVDLLIELQAEVDAATSRATKDWRKELEKQRKDG
jgi:hypothetical protein